MDSKKHVNSESSQHQILNDTFYLLGFHLNRIRILPLKDTPFVEQVHILKTMETWPHCKKTFLYRYYFIQLFSIHKNLPHSR